MRELGCSNPEAAVSEQAAAAMHAGEVRPPHITIEQAIKRVIDMNNRACEVRQQTAQRFAELLGADGADEPERDEITADAPMLPVLERTLSDLDDELSRLFAVAVRIHEL